MSFLRRTGRALEARASSIPLPLRLFFAPIIEESAEEIAYWRLAKAGFDPAAIVDVGAYEGKWAQKVRHIFPHCPILMIEAQESKRTVLEAVANSVRAEFAITALSDNAGREVVFYEMETGSSLLPELTNVERTERKVVTETLDGVTQARLADLSPLFVKLDVQGAEMMVIEGGSSTLARTELVQLEVPFMPYNEGAPSLLPIISKLEEHGFVPFDIAGTHRPDGLRAVQIDILFVRKGSFLRTIG